MRAVLEELDISTDDDLETTRDADFLSADRARAWASALDGSYDRLISFDIEDPTFEGGFRNELHVADAVAAPPDARPLSDSDRRWIRDFVQFLTHSGGVEFS